MSDGTKIEWTDATWNPITGCSVTSPGCKNCYAMKLAGTRLRHIPSRVGLTQDSAAGPVWTGEVRFNEQWLAQPLQWTRPRMIFVCAHGDLFHESVPDEWIAAIFGVMAACPQHKFQVLTKRAARMREFMTSTTGPDFQQEACKVLDRIGFERGCGSAFDSPEWPLPNVWLGVSVEDQTRANERIPLLLNTPAAVRWLSAEPLLGPVDLAHIMRESPDSDYAYCDNALTGWRSTKCGGTDDNPALDWVVVGGESGDGARPMHPDWARELRDQCAAAGVAFLFKQWGEWELADPRHHPTRAVHWWKDNPGHAYSMVSVGKKAAGRLLDGVQHDGYPA